MDTRKRFSSRLMLACVIGLAVLQAVVELRVRGSAAVRGHDFLGYAPNLLAAFALPFFFHGMMVLSNRRDDGGQYSWAQLWRENASIAGSVAIAAGGLVLWEFVQVTRPNRTYDPQDIAATLAGALAFLLVVWAGRMLTRHAHVVPVRVPNHSVSQ